MKFTFTSESFGFGSPKNTMEFNSDHIDDVLAYFKQFLKGAGYEINTNESIQVVNETEWPEDYYNTLNTNWPFDAGTSDVYVDPFVAGGGTYEFHPLDLNLDEEVTITVPVEEPKKRKGKK